MTEENEMGAIISEKIMLGSVILENTVMHEAVELIQPGDFYLNSHRKVFEAMLCLYERSEPIEFGSLWSTMLERGWVHEIGDMAWLATLTDGVSQTDSIAFYARQVKEKALKRAIAKAATRIIDLAFEEQDTRTFVHEAQQLFWNACDAHLPTGFVPLGSAAFKYLERIEDMQGRGEMVHGLQTGFDDLDSRLLGMQKGDLVIFAARPSVGKTTFAFNVALNIARAGLPVAFFSIEMGVERIGEKAVSLAARVDSSLMRVDRLPKETWQRVYDAANDMSELPFQVCDDSRLTSMDLKAKAQRMKREHGLELIVVDYLQLMQGDPKMNKFERVGENVKDIKAIAKELDVPILLLSQLNRDIETRQQGSEPVMSDLGESGEIERTADVIVFLYNELNGVIDLKIAKNRTGATGSLQLAYFKQYNQFASAYTR